MAVTAPCSLPGDRTMGSSEDVLFSQREWRKVGIYIFNQLMLQWPIRQIVLSLDYILLQCNNYNKLTQRNTPIHLLYETTRCLYGTISCFCYSEIVSYANLGTFDPCDKANHKPLHEMYLGPGVHKMIIDENLKKNSTKLNTFYDRCQTFYIVLCQQIFKRFDLDNTLWRMGSFFPKEVPRSKI